MLISNTVTLLPSRVSSPIRSSICCLISVPVAVDGIIKCSSPLYFNHPFMDLAQGYTVSAILCWSPCADFIFFLNPPITEVQTHFFFLFLVCVCVWECVLLTRELCYLWCSKITQGQKRKIKFERGNFKYRLICLSCSIRKRCFLLVAHKVRLVVSQQIKSEILLLSNTALCVISRKELRTVKWSS
jgi:hypothetical protein